MRGKCQNIFLMDHRIFLFYLPEIPRKPSLFFFLAKNVARVTEVKTDLILFKFSVLFDSEEVQEGNI